MRLVVVVVMFAVACKGKASQQPPAVGSASGSSVVVGDAAIVVGDAALVVDGAAIVGDAASDAASVVDATSADATVTAAVYADRWAIVRVGDKCLSYRQCPPNRSCPPPPTAEIPCPKDLWPDEPVTATKDPATNQCSFVATCPARKDCKQRTWTVELPCPP